MKRRSPRSRQPNRLTPTPINNASMNLNALHAAGTLGQGMKVAVIDSGIRARFPHIYARRLGDRRRKPRARRARIQQYRQQWARHVRRRHDLGERRRSASPASRSRVAALHCPSCATPVTRRSARFRWSGRRRSSSIYALRVFPADRRRAGIAESSPPWNGSSSCARTSTTACPRRRTPTAATTPSTSRSAT